MDATALKTIHLHTVEAEPFLTEVYLAGGDVSMDENLPELEVFLDKLEVLWPLFMKAADAEEVLELLGLSRTEQSWQVDLNIVSNATIQALNARYRQKDQATDVLTFTLLADSSARDQLTLLPEVQLGTIFISLDWAKAHVAESKVQSKEALTGFLVERFIHGLLHLLGMHHDTMDDYETVVRIQNRVLAGVFGEAAAFES